MPGLFMSLQMRAFWVPLEQLWHAATGQQMMAFWVPFASETCFIFQVGAVQDKVWVRTLLAARWLVLVVPVVW